MNYMLGLGGNAKDQVDALHKAVNFCSVFFCYNYVKKSGLQEKAYWKSGNLSDYFKFSSSTIANNSFIITFIIKEVLIVKSTVNTCKKQTLVHTGIVYKAVLHAVRYSLKHLRWRPDIKHMNLHPLRMGRASYYTYLTKAMAHCTSTKPRT